MLEFISLHGSTLLAQLSDVLILLILTLTLIMLSIIAKRYMNISQSKVGITSVIILQITTSRLFDLFILEIVLLFLLVIIYYYSYQYISKKFSSTDNQ